MQGKMLSSPLEEIPEHQRSQPYNYFPANLSHSAVLVRVLIQVLVLLCCGTSNSTLETGRDRRRGSDSTSTVTSTCKPPHSNRNQFKFVAYLTHCHAGLHRICLDLLKFLFFFLIFLEISSEVCIFFSDFLTIFLFFFSFY